MPEMDKPENYNIIDIEMGIVCDDAANDDWIRAARLAKKADAGDEEARRELEKMENTKLVTYDDED
ncbi:MAG TPA: hypothetical protein PLE04_11615 [Syntrophales bacterium]|nr:hypothetical protein [Syntrophales bacterium]